MKSFSEGLRDRFLLFPLGFWIIKVLTAYVLFLCAVSLAESVAFRVSSQAWFFSGVKLDPLHEAGAGLGFWAVVYFCLNFLLATRWKFVEDFFGGMDRAYLAHGHAGKMGFYFVLLHMVILTVQAAPDLELLLQYLVPGRHLGYSFGVLGTATLAVLVLLTLWVRIPYAQWLSTHKLMIIPFLFGVGHAYVLQQDWYMAVLGTLGTGAWIYTTFLASSSRRHREGVVEEVEHWGRIHNVWIRPHGVLNLQPGQFLYFSVRESEQITSEPHPFSLSGQKNGLVRLTVKSVGDYTETLASLAPGQKVVLTGPFGRFGQRRLKSSHPQVWIAGGIGITPFLSMLQQVAESGLRGPRLFVWLVRQREEGLFLREIEETASRLPEFHFHLHVTSELGRIDGPGLKALDPALEWNKASVFVCGPEGMMKELKTLAAELGTPRFRIHDEAFSLRN